MKKRIIYITESSGYGGAEKYLAALASGAQQRGHEVSVALPFKAANSAFRERLKAAGVAVLDLPQYRANYPLNLVYAVNFFRAHQGALFHFSLPYSDSCRWLLLAAAVLKRRYFITEHLVPPNPYGAGLYFAVTHLLFNRLKKLSYRMADMVIAVSQGNRDILTRTYGMPRDKLTVIHNGIDCAASVPRGSSRPALFSEFDLPPDSTVLTTVGRLAEQKGQIYLISALEKLVRSYPALVLLLVGEGPLRNELESAVRDKNLTAHVRFTGFRNDIPEILAAADIFVLPSLHEGFAFIVLEAMAAGTAVVATRALGVAEAIIDGETGLLCKVGDPGDLAAKIDLLLCDQEKRAALGRKARERALAEFDISRMISTTWALYEGAP